jgi:hypothetical protein
LSEKDCLTKSGRFAIMNNENWRGMKLIVIVAAGVVIIAGAVVGTYFVMQSSSDQKAVNEQEVDVGEDIKPRATKTACDILTQEVANEILGSGATKRQLPSTSQVSTDAVHVSNCLYEREAGDDVLTVANILVRGAKMAAGYESNEFGFNDTKNFSGTEGEAADSPNIENLGDAAYYNPAFEQVNVLVNDGQYWVIAQADGGRASAERLARLVIANLIK